MANCVRTIRLLIQLYDFSIIIIGNGISRDKSICVWNDHFTVSSSPHRSVLNGWNIIHSMMISCVVISIIQILIYTLRTMCLFRNTSADHVGCVFVVWVSVRLLFPMESWLKCCSFCLIYLKMSKTKSVFIFRLGCSDALGRKQDKQN